MFFIVPSPAPDPTPPTARPSASGEHSLSAVGDVDAYYRRRVAAACDRCRLKKARCSGEPAPCKKCKRDGVICNISKDKKIDNQPKPPAYVRMVESQRDLLLKAVQELRQKSTACRQNGTEWDATTDINKILQDLGIHVDASNVVRESIMEELAVPRPSQKIVNLATPEDDQSRIQSKDAIGNRSSSLDISSTEFGPMPMLNTKPHSDFDFAETTPDLNPMFNTNEQFNKAASMDTGMGFDNCSLFDETMLMTDWSPSSPLNFDFQIPTDHQYLNMDIDNSGQL